MKLIVIADIIITIAIIAGIKIGIDEAAFQAFFALCVVGGICVAFFAWGKWYHNRHNLQDETVNTGSISEIEWHEIEKYIKNQNCVLN